MGVLLYLISYCTFALNVWVLGIHIMWRKYFNIVVAFRRDFFYLQRRGGVCLALIWYKYTMSCYSGRRTTIVMINSHVKLLPVYSMTIRVLSTWKSRRREIIKKKRSFFTYRLYQFVLSAATATMASKSRRCH
jgi:hypothetical protein